MSSFKDNLRMQQIKGNDLLILFFFQQTPLYLQILSQTLNPEVVGSLFVEVHLC